MLCEKSATRYLCKLIIYTEAEKLYPPPNIKLPMPFENFENPSKVFL